MSVSTFHHNFKAVTSTSPLQYLKSYRLHKGADDDDSRRYEGQRRGDAVGYERIAV